MGETSQAIPQQSQQVQAADHRQYPRPDLRDAPENPPVEQEDLDRGREKLERVIAK